MARTVSTLFFALFAFQSILASANEKEFAGKYAELKSSVISGSKCLAGGNVEAFFEALPANSILKSDLDAFAAKAKQGRKAHIENFGDPLGEVELVREELSGDSYCQFSLSERFENGMIFWRLIYYRATDDWNLHHIHFDPPEKGLQAVSKNSGSIEDQPQAMADQMMERFANDEIKLALEYFQQQAPPRLAKRLREPEIQSLSEKIRLECEEGNTSLHDFQLVKCETAGDKFVSFHYNNRRAINAHQVQLTLYKGRDGWQFFGWNLSNEAKLVFQAMDSSTMLVR